jgi:predicted nucleic acid-binding Zn ribbon protein
MYKLKCENCGYLNDVSTEYLTLCGNCNRKLNNSFSEWRKSNPTKPFDVYKKEVCIDEELASEKVKLIHKQTKRRHTRLVVVLVIVGIFLGSVFTLFYFKKNELLNSLVSLTNTSDDILNNEWERKAYYDLHFYLETPFKPDTYSVSFPDQVRELIVSNAAYYSETDAGAFSFMLSTVEFLPEIPFNFENSIQGSINSIENQPGISDLTSTRTPYKIKGKEAIMINGTLKRYGILFDYKMLIFIGNHQLSQVLVSYHVGDLNAQKAADRIFKSLKLL